MLAIVAAFNEEVKHYLKRGGFRVAARQDSLRFYQAPTDPEVIVVEGGAGRQKAEKATRQLIETYQPDIVVSAGFAGAVQADVRLGDIFICDRLMSVEGPAALWGLDTVRERSPIHADLVEKLRGKEDTHQKYDFCGCLSVPQFVSSSSMKAWIGSTFPVSIIDMESYWVSETAAAYGVPHVVVRSVLDTMEQTIPAFVGETVSAEEGQRKWERAIKYLVSRPTEAPKLIRLASQVKIAGASLSEFLTRLSTAVLNTSTVATG